MVTVEKVVSLFSEKLRVRSSVYKMQVKVSQNHDARYRPMRPRKVCIVHHKFTMKENKFQNSSLKLLLHNWSKYLSKFVASIMTNSIFTCFWLFKDILFSVLVLFTYVLCLPFHQSTIFMDSILNQSVDCRYVVKGAWLARVMGFQYRKLGVVFTFLCVVHLA